MSLAFTPVPVLAWTCRGPDSTAGAGPIGLELTDMTSVDTPEALDRALDESTAALRDLADRFTAMPRAEYGAARKALLAERRALVARRVAVTLVTCPPSRWSSDVAGCGHQWVPGPAPTACPQCGREWTPLDEMDVRTDLLRARPDEHPLWKLSDSALYAEAWRSRRSVERLRAEGDDAEFVRELERRHAKVVDEIDRRRNSAELGRLNRIIARGEELANAVLAVAEAHGGTLPGVADEAVARALQAYADAKADDAAGDRAWADFQRDETDVQRGRLRAQLAELDATIAETEALMAQTSDKAVKTREGHQRKLAKQTERCDAIAAELAKLDR
jgi:hypothetical protein